jgi:UDP-N-acetylglucosamine pyrophosphorylase
VEDGREPDFQDVRRFPHFNTNNLWIHLESLRDRLAQGLELPVIVNPKAVEGAKVLQLETAMGAAIGSFARTRGLVVPRTRFAPVKTCADLLVRRSDCYLVDPAQGTLLRNPARTGGEPVITLGPAYKALDDFDALVPVLPSLVEADALTVEGRVRFDAPVRIRGKVTLRHAGDGAASLRALGRDVLQDETIEL